MKILIACTLYPPYILGGAEVSTALLAEGLVASGNEVSVITTGEEGGKEEVNGVTIYRIKNRNIYWRYPQREKPLISKALWHFVDSCNLLYKSEVCRILDEVNPDIMHSGNLCGLSTIVWECAKKRGVPIIHTLRDYYLLCPQQTMCKNGTPCKSQCSTCKAYSAHKKKLSQYVDAVIGISNYILDIHLRNGFFKNAKCKKVIANSVNIPYRGRRNRQNDVIGYLGRISPEKGIEFLIEAFLGSDNENKTLLIAGDGNVTYVTNLKNKYSSSGISFVGKVKAQTFLEKIDLLVVPSLWHEPFGRVVIEAYSQHVPVLMANNGGLRDLSYEGIGWNFDTSDKDPLVSSLNKFYANELVVKEEMFDQMLKRYSSTHIVEEYVKVYKEIAIVQQGD